MRRNLVSFVLLVGFSGCTSLVMYPAFQSAITSAHRSACRSNLKAIALACQQYRADFNGNYPPLSDGGSRGWTMLLAPYKAETFSCPAGYKANFSPSSDYFFNAQLAMQKSSATRDPMFTVAFGDGEDNGPSNSHFWELPTNWDSDNSPLQRHWGTIFAFADGHARILSRHRFEEWIDYADDEKEANQEFTRQCHYKISPTQSAFRPRPHSSRP